MNKLSEALKQSRQRDGGRALGFAPASNPKGRGILVGIHTGADASGAKTGLGAGADFAVVHTGDGSAAATAIAAADAGDAFFGAHVGTLNEGDSAKLTEAGCAFIVVDPIRALASEAGHEDLGVVIPVDLASDEHDLQTLSRIDLDAVLVPEELGELTLSRQASLIRAAALTGRRLMVKADVNLAESELKVLRDSGVGALLVPDSATAKDIKGLIGRIESLAPKKTADDDGRQISLGHHSASEG